MSTLLHKRILLFALAIAAAAPSFACGPYFPPSLLEDRQASLLNLVEGSFDFEASRLVPVSAKGLVAVEGLPWASPGEAREDAEQAHLGAAYARVEAMRTAPGDALALKVGAGLPAEARLYTFASRAFLAGDPTAARNRYAAVLELPKAQRGFYGPWAQYMLGRLDLAELAEGSGLAPSERGIVAKRAVASFRAVRAGIAESGADPLGLAIASLGEEAQVAMRLLDYPTAAHLYAEQAAQGSGSGRSSLLQLARLLLRDEVALQQAINDPLLQKLVTAYLYTRRFELDEIEGYTSGADGYTASSILQRYFRAIESVDQVTVAGADQFAAAAYRMGRFEVAQKLAERSDSPLAYWVRAKLALRANDRDAAAAYYAKASSGFEREDRWNARHDPDSGKASDIDPLCRVQSERGVLALTRGDYVEALRLLHAGKSWPDEAYVAERVLTLDELKTFVDAEVPAVAPKTPSSKEGENEDGMAPPHNDLRGLLGRRLMRAGRYAEAPAYYSSELVAKATEYAGARQRAARSGSIEGAQVLFQAATLARQSGMQLLGSELLPDNALLEGDYDDDYPSLKSQPASFVATDEPARVLKNRIEPDVRFHYRRIAADLANQAADRVPARSQAFAAMLCSATGWLINRDPLQAQISYRRYVAQGAHLNWAAHFGSDCPAPDFAAAATRLHVERVRAYKHLLRGAAPFVSAGLFALGIGILAWRWRRRRYRAR